MAIKTKSVVCIARKRKRLHEEAGKMEIIKTTCLTQKETRIVLSEKGYETILFISPKLIDDLGACKNIKEIKEIVAAKIVNNKGQYRGKKVGEVANLIWDNFLTILDLVID